MTAGSDPAQPFPGGPSRTASGPGTAGEALHAVLDRARRRLAGAGVVSSRADAELLVAHVLGVGRGELLARSLRGDALDDETVRRATALVDRRCERIPLQHLTGRAPFRGLDLAVGPGVFVPRPETEVVAGLAVAEAARVAEAGREPLVVDLCTGSGAIALAVGHEVTSARVLALELDPGALVWARHNVEQSGPGDRVQLRAGDVRGCATTVLVDWAGQVDVVVANPPYIPPDALPRDAEVRDHDPMLALYGGGADGLAVPAAVVEAAGQLLRPGGLLVMEHAESQAVQARALAATPLWREVRTAPDLNRRPRALLARRAYPG